MDIVKHIIYLRMIWSYIIYNPSTLGSECDLVPPSRRGRALRPYLWGLVGDRGHEHAARGGCSSRHGRCRVLDGGPGLESGDAAEMKAVKVPRKNSKEK